MKRGFNKFGNGNEEQQSASEPSHQQSQNQNMNYNLINQFANFSPGSNGYSDTMVVTLFQIVEQQSQALQSLMRKVQLITDRTLELTEKVKQLKKSRNEDNQDHTKQKILVKTQTVKTGGDILEASALIKILFGSEKKYDFKLKLSQKLDLPLFRERNFFLQLELTDAEGKPVRNSNKIPLSLALYSSENPPKFIQKNTAGQKILKGYIQQSLHQGVCRFEKIQIKEVTSHFRNGWVFIVIIPCMTPLGTAVNNSDIYVDYTKIEPLVLEKIVVKAKKLKEAKQENAVMVEHEQEAEADEMQAEDAIKNEEQFYSDER